MKVVLFCGGQGLRMRDFSNNIPKPMVIVGNRPIIWQVMKYYAYFGHKDFILCLGYQSETIKRYFMNYEEFISNDFTLYQGGQKIELASRDIEDWTITFVDTGVDACIGERLMAVQSYLDGEDVFLANYSDNVTDFHLPDMTNHFLAQDKVAGFLSVRPSQSFHVVHANDQGDVQDIKNVTDIDVWINGGYFILRSNIFDYMRQGEELVLEPFERLIEENKLITYRYDGFWAAMDTFKEKQSLDDRASYGKAVWQVWKK